MAYFTVTKKLNYSFITNFEIELILAPFFRESLTIVGRCSVHTDSQPLDALAEALSDNEDASTPRFG